MVTPERLRRNAARLGALADAFEVTYLHFLDVGKGEMEERDKGAHMFYLMKEITDDITRDAELLAANMEMCDVIYAAELCRRRKLRPEDKKQNNT